MGELTDRPIYIIAGEPSGDRLGGALMRAMSGTQFRGIGGRDMTAAGLASLFDMRELSIMGISEILPKLPLMLRRIRETAEDIVAAGPAALITIDSPDFTLRVAARARRDLPDLRVIHYVAPSVWAWRPKRAVKMARVVDHVLALLPFEPPYMEAAGMSCDFVGHPAAARRQPTSAEIAEFRQGLGIGADQKLLLLAPGSRKGEVRRLMPDFLAALGQLRAKEPDLAVICPVAETVDAEVRAALAPLDPGAVLIPASAGEERKQLAFAAADSALCASGTVTLELAAAGTPMVAAYRTTWLTAQIVRRVVKVDTANLINLVTGETPVPEFLQEHCTPEALAGAVADLLYDPECAARQHHAFDQALTALGRGGLPPAERAALSVRNFLERDQM